MALVPMDRRRRLPVAPMAETLETVLPTSRVSGRTARQVAFCGAAGRIVMQRKRFGAAGELSGRPSAVRVLDLRNPAARGPSGTAETCARASPLDPRPLE